MGAKVRPWFGFAPEEFQAGTAGSHGTPHRLVHGESTELMVKTWAISRAEQDQLAFESHQRPRPRTHRVFIRTWSLSTWGYLKTTISAAIPPWRNSPNCGPAFDFSGAGTLTAGNSTPMTDGASAVLLGTEAWARERNLPVLAYLSYGKVAAVDYIERKKACSWPLRTRFRECCAMRN